MEVGVREERERRTGEGSCGVAGSTAAAGPCGTSPGLVPRGTPRRPRRFQPSRRGLGGCRAGPSGIFAYSLLVRRLIGVTVRHASGSIGPTARVGPDSRGGPLLPPARAVRARPGIVVRRRRRSQRLELLGDPSRRRASRRPWVARSGRHVAERRPPLAGGFNLRAGAHPKPAPRSDAGLVTHRPAPLHRRSATGTPLARDRGLKPPATRQGRSATLETGHSGKCFVDPWSGIFGSSGDPTHSEPCHTLRAAGGGTLDAKRHGLPPEPGIDSLLEGCGPCPVNVPRGSSRRHARSKARRKNSDVST